VRTLDRVLGGLVAGGGPPPGLVLTLPKVVHVDQVAAYAALLAALEDAHGLPPGSLRFEIQVETPQAILAADGRLPLAPMLDAAEGRCTGLHYGTYDYSAAMGVPAAEQRADHPVAQTAKAVMRLAAAGTGVEVSDGSTNRLPVGDRATVHAHWRLHADLVLGALADGVRQGWDLHPAQLVTRHLVTIVAMRRALPDATARLRAYLASASDAEGDGPATLDEPATAQALAADVVRAVDWGAADEAPTAAACGVPLADLRALADRRVA
jgi:citrate lyase beta subunit